jgi:peptidoglycan endopeptidase LytE
VTAHQTALQQRFYAGVAKARHEAELKRYYAGVQHAQEQAALARFYAGVQRSAAAAAAPAPQAATPVSGPASNLNWSGLAACESSGNPGSVSSGGYMGLYQFDQRTWNSVGGSGSPTSASPAEQTYRAEILYSQRGSSPWPVCGSRLGG